MARSERVVVSEDRDSIVTENEHTAAVTPTDVLQYVAVNVLFRAVTAVIRCLMTRPAHRPHEAGLRAEAG